MAQEPDGALGWLLRRCVLDGHGHLVDALHRHARVPASDRRSRLRSCRLRCFRWVIAMAVSGFALLVVAGTLSTRRAHRVGGFLMGLGISGMHYTGMAACKMLPGISYHAGAARSSPFSIAIDAVVRQRSGSPSLRARTFTRCALRGCRGLMGSPSPACITPAWRAADSPRSVLSDGSDSTIPGSRLAGFSALVLRFALISSVRPCDVTYLHQQKRRSRRGQRTRRARARSRKPSRLSDPAAEPVALVEAAEPASRSAIGQAPALCWS